MWDLIVSVPDHCLSFYFANLKRKSGSIISIRTKFPLSLNPAN